VWGSLEEAKARGATTVLLCCNPAYHGHELPDRVIAPNTDAEALTGSTRLKAGSATKLVLNLITTLAMTHSGKVLSNLMIDLNPSNIKLRARAVRIVSSITGATAVEAQTALEQSDWVVREACDGLETQAPKA
jgi:N-acetylmuramic acid 6-phosphate etherase